MKEVMIENTTIGMDINMLDNNMIIEENSGISSTVILSIVIVVCVILGIVLGILAGRKSANK